MSDLPSVRQVRLGRSGLEVSEVTLGCMSFGQPGAGTHPWTLGLGDARSIVRRAVDLGITSFDTANVYSHGSSEEIVGTLLAECGPRESFVIATKVHGTMPGAGGNRGGLSRRTILEQVDASLRRLGTDYIDLYQVHRFDPSTPVEETMQALDDVVRAGKVRYVGASSMWTWQFAQMQHVATIHGWTTFVSMQDHYNLLDREEGREMHPYCTATGVGVMPWSPLARGRLARPVAAEATSRSETDEFGRRLYRQVAADAATIDEVGRIARERDVSMAQVALAWVLSRQVVSSPIIGATSVDQLEDTVRACRLELTEDECRQLEEHYTPRWPGGFG